MDTTTQNLTAPKEFPLAYSDAVYDTISKLAFNPSKVQILGSSGIRSQYWAADYDLYEVVTTSSISQIAKELQDKIKALRMDNSMIIGDMKIGGIPSREVISPTAYVDTKGNPVDYNPTQARSKLDQLKASGVITEGELSEGMRILKDRPSASELHQAKKLLQFQTLRWTPDDVIKGYKLVKDQGSTIQISLEAAMSTKYPTKIDTVTFIQNRPVEFSIVYTFKVGRRLVNPLTGDIDELLRNDALFYAESGAYFKALKRIFSLLRYRYLSKGRGPGGNRRFHPVLNDIVRVLNSDLGILYSVSSDLGTLADLIKNHDRISPEKFESILSGFRHRLGNVYSVTPYLVKEKGILSRLKALGSQRDENQVIRELSSLQDRLDGYLSTESKKYYEWVKPAVSP